MNQLESWFRLNIGKKFFTVGVVRHWCRMPTVGAVSLQVFKPDWKLFAGLVEGVFAHGGGE